MLTYLESSVALIRKKATFLASRGLLVVLKQKQGHQGMYLTFGNIKPVLALHVTSQALLEGRGMIFRQHYHNTVILQLVLMH
jgi:hypothetical protein